MSQSQTSNTDTNAQAKGKDAENTRITDKVRVENMKFQHPKKNAIHVVKVFADHIQIKSVTHIYNNILHWYNVFDEKVYLRKENPSVL